MSEFNDVIDWSVTPSVGNAITFTENVNALHSTFESEGKDFDLGEGTHFYVFPEKQVIENPTRGAFNADIETGVTNVGDGALPSGATVAIFPVQIQPAAGQRGTVGDLILSNNGLSGAEKHFVSTQKNASLNTDFITFEATGIPQAIFDEFLEWDGGQAVTGNTLQRNVSRTAAGHTELRIRVKGTNVQVDLINVWTVWASITGLVQPIGTTDIKNGSGLILDVRVDTSYSSSATINPATILTRNDRPNLSGKNATPPPAGTSLVGTPLSNGANMKWDVSRRASRTVQTNLSSPLPANIQSILTNVSLPNNLLVGNDDSGTSDENNTPPTLTSQDDPQFHLGTKGGDTGDTVSLDVDFEEFVRLEINGVWYLISNSESWSVRARFEREVVTETFWNLDTNGDGTIDSSPVTENQVGGDFNGDGDTNDNISIWRDNDSTTNN